MRKLESKEDEKRRTRRNQIIIGVVLVGVMLFSVLGYGFQSQGNDNNKENVVTYNGFQFVGTSNGFWTLDLGSFQFGFSNTPKDVSQVNGTVNLLSSYSGQPLYIYSQNPQAEAEVYRNFNYIVLRSQYACLNSSNITFDTVADENCDPAWPIKGCENNFLIIEESDTPEIIQEDNCVFLKGPSDELVKVADEFMFKAMGVMK